MQEVFRQLRAMGSSIGARSTKLSHDDPAGLDRENALEQITAAAATGNERVSLAGTSPSGAKMRGDNHNFSLSVQPPELPSEEFQRAVELVRLYQDNVNSGILSEDASESTDERIRGLLE